MQLKHLKNGEWFKFDKDRLEEDYGICQKIGKCSHPFNLEIIGTNIYSTQEMSIERVYYDHWKVIKISPPVFKEE